MKSLINISKKGLLSFFLFIIVLVGFTACDFLFPPPESLIIIQDFESEDIMPDSAEPINAWDQIDYAYFYNGDGNENGTNGTINEITAFSITADGAGSTNRSATIRYNIGDNDTFEYEGPAIAGYGTYSDSPIDLSDSTGISFYAKGTRILTLKIAVRTTEQISIDENNDYEATVSITGDWQYFEVPWEDIVAQDWWNNIPPLDPSQIELINLKVEEFDGVQIAGEYSIDEISTY